MYNANNNPYLLITNSFEKYLNLYLLFNHYYYYYHYFII